MKTNGYIISILLILLFSCENAALQSEFLQTELTPNKNKSGILPYLTTPINSINKNEINSDTTTVKQPVLSVPEGDFWNTITVFAFSDTEDAEIYYTTDKSEPSKASLSYSKKEGIKINKTTTLKVIAIKSELEKSQIVTAEYTKRYSKTYKENKSGVILQGFNWDSAPNDNNHYTLENPNPQWKKWYKKMLNASDEIKETFEYVWFPPPSKTDTASSQGYGPTELNNLNNCYGTENELKKVIEAIKPAKAIADIVINHRAGTTSWSDFTNPRWTDNYTSICRDDDFFNTGNPGEGIPNDQKGNLSTGILYKPYRNLDHENTIVQQGIYSWMNSVLRRAGFVGWRYDFAKGFDGKYVGIYNEMSEAAFSVGEYWPECNYQISNIEKNWNRQISDWINKTSEKGKKSRAFDYVLKHNLNNAFGWYKKEDWYKEEERNFYNHQWNMGFLAEKNSLMHSAPEHAVTFVDNHDTGSTQQNWELNWDNVPVAYTFILTHPGYPCVAWQHYFTDDDTNSGSHWQYRGGEIVSGTDKTFQEHIKYLIELRKEVGIEYDSKMEIVNQLRTLYVAKITGTKGKITVAIGGDYWEPNGDGYAGNFPIYQGTNFKIWQKNKRGIESKEVNITVTSSSNWIWNDNAAIFAWVWGGAHGYGQWVPANGRDSGTTVKFTIHDNAIGFLVARCIEGTTTPNWNVTGDQIGRIYNKSQNVDFTKETTSYTVGEFTKYPGF